MTRSLKAAVQKQGLGALFEKLEKIVPDISRQYSTFQIESDFQKIKVRGQHSYQISLVEKAIKEFGVKDSESLTVVDIGDSAGAHITYLNNLFPNIRSISVNLDKTAVDKIRALGLEAVHARAEDLVSLNINPDVFLCFETLEHMSDPIRFLNSLAVNTECRAFVITVPYVAQSRVGLHHIRQENKIERNAENTHIFELSPRDWRLVFKHSGWAIQQDGIYLQYPGGIPGLLMKPVWKRSDFEGFYGAILIRDLTWSNLYADW